MIGKRIFSTIFAILIGIAPIAGFGVDFCERDETSSSLGPDTGLNNPIGSLVACTDSATIEYYKGKDGVIFSVQSCNKCSGAYTNTSKTDGSHGCNVEYHICECNCGDECKTDDTFQGPDNNGVLSKITSVRCYCGGNNAECIKTIKYQCADGYWGNPESVNDACTKCPTASYGDPSSKAGDNETQDKCYITMQEGQYYDEKGVFKVEGNVTCKYGKESSGDYNAERNEDVPSFPGIF